MASTDFLQLTQNASSLQVGGLLPVSLASHLDVARAVSMGYYGYYQPF